MVQNSAGVSTFYATLNTTIIPEGKLLTAKILHNWSSSPIGCAEPQYLNGTTCVTSCPSYYYGNYTTRLCLPCEYYKCNEIVITISLNIISKLAVLSSSGYVAAFNATFYDVTFLNTTPINTIVFGFTLYFNPTLPIGTSVVVSIAGNVGPTRLASDYFGFTTVYAGSPYSYSFPYVLNNPSDYILTNQIYYIPQPPVSTFQFNLRALPYIDYANVGVTIIGKCCNISSLL